MAAEIQPLPDDVAILAADRRAYVEQRIFALSPLNVWLTAAVIYLVPISLYALAAAIDGAAWVRRVGGGYALDDRARVALILDLVPCVALAMQRYTWLSELAEARAAEARMGRLSSAIGGPFLAEDRAGLRRATLLGLIGGALVVLVFRAPGVGLHDVTLGSARFVWFVAATLFLAVLFARGVQLTRAGLRNVRKSIDEELVVDLMHIERLYAWGRAAARNSLTWFAVSAAAALLFISQVSLPVSAGLLGACAVMGLWGFVSATHRLHRRIHDAKTSELDTVRSEIAELRAHPGAEPATSVRLHSLLAYEARIAAVREWPFDQTILLRVAGSTLILAIPWFGQAVAGVLVEHAGQLFH